MRSTTRRIRFSLDFLEMNSHLSPSSVPFPNSNKGILPAATTTCRSRDGARTSAELSSARLSPALGTRSRTKLAEKGKNRSWTWQMLLAGRCPCLRSILTDTARRWKRQRLPHPGSCKASQREFSSPFPQKEWRTAKGGRDESGTRGQQAAQDERLWLGPLVINPSSALQHPPPCLSSPLGPTSVALLLQLCSEQAPVQVNWRWGTGGAAAPQTASVLPFC